MTGKFKNIASLILLLVFLLPSVVKLEHHHEDTLICKAKNEKHYHKLHERCAICSFEFSVFSQDFQQSAIQKNQPESFYSNQYRSADHSNLTKYAFLLRAPPR